ncbi:MAG: hypothetical protein IKB06_03415 [Clostridia bacterium]|nr:hypothetical protein [Clostridia bacterium]
MLLSFDKNVLIKTQAYAIKTENELQDELTDGVHDELDKIETADLDEFLVDGLELGIVEVDSFKEFVLSFLNGTYYQDYNSIFDLIVFKLKENFKSILSFVVLLLSLVLLHELFNNFCVDKYQDVKKSVKIVFSLIVILIVCLAVKELSDLSVEITKKIFSFTKVLFPIILNLILVSGASGTFSGMTVLSTFLINTGSYLFVYVLSPIAVSIFVLSIVGSAFGSKRIGKTTDIFKSLFKWIVGLFFAVVGIFGLMNFVVTSTKDGVGLKITKFAIKNYIPVLGGYISDGFDFVKAGSLLLKNAFGIGGVLVLFVMILKPFLIYFCYLISFKILALFSSYLSGDFYSNLFDNVSKCVGYFIAVLMGVFLIFFVFLIMCISSVSVV